MVLAWCLVEIVRYPYYFFQLLGRVPYALLWLRYTLFYVLYPIGVASEWMQGYLALPLIAKHRLFYIDMPNAVNFAFNYYYFVLFVLLIVYPLGK